MSKLVRVTYRKYDGSLHWNCAMRLLGEDEHGVWLGWGAGLQMRRGDEPPVTFTSPHVALFPRDEWWTASFYVMPYWAETYCDITTVPEWPTPDEVTMVDLDLDVIRLHEEQHTYIDDEDEFLEHQKRYSYPPDVIAGARSAADSLLVMVTEQAEPFRSVHQSWMSMVEHCQGDPAV